MVGSLARATTYKFQGGSGGHGDAGRANKRLDWGSHRGSTDTLVIDRWEGEIRQIVAEGRDKRVAERQPSVGNRPTLSA
jgi:hypothetical protein